MCEQRDQEAEGEWEGRGEESEREGWEGGRTGMGGKESEREGRAGEREKGRVRKNAS